MKGNFFPFLLVNKITLLPDISIYYFPKFKYKAHLYLSALCQGKPEGTMFSSRVEFGIILHYCADAVDVFVCDSYEQLCLLMTRFMLDNKRATTRNQYCYLPTSSIYRHPI